MGDIRVRIGPSVDRAAFDAAFASVAQSAQRAFAKISTEATKAGLAEEKAIKRTVDQEQRIRASSRRSQETEQQRMLRTMEGAERTKVQVAQRVAREREQVERQYYRELDRQRRQDEQSARRYYSEMKRQAQDASKAHPRVGVGLGHGVSVAMSGPWGYASGAMRMGMGVAGDVAHAYGVNTDLGEAMHRNAEMETLATQITNEAHEHGQTFADPTALRSQALDIGTRTGTGANQVMEGYQEFVGKTGDLKTIQDSMEELSKIAKGTGSSLKDVVGAAADVSNQLGDIPDKGKRVNEIMRIMAGEAKLGAVPMRALASQTAKVVASAQLMEGDVGKNMGLLTAVAQEARLRGGAASASQASTSVQSLMNTFGKGARAKAFGALGIGLTGAGGKTRNVEDIIVESLQKTQKGNAQASNLAFGELFADTRARNGVRGFESIFRSTYNTSTGSEQERLADATKAVREEFDRLQRAAMDQKEVDDSFARAMATGQSQAEVFNNQMQKLAQTTQNALLPAFIKLVPVVTDAVGVLGQVVGFLGGPKKPEIAGGVANVAALNAGIRAGHVDAAMLTKAKQDSYDLDVAGYNKRTQAENLRKEANDKSVLGSASMSLKAQASAAAHAAGAALSDTNTPWYLHPSQALQAAGRAAGGAYGTGGRDYRRGMRSEADTAEKEGREANEAAKETRELTKYIQNNPLYVRIVDTPSGAAQPSTNSLSDRPSGQ